MADYITPEEVPSAGSLENILGFDAADKWAKMPGSTLAKASDLAVTDGKVTAAQEAAETAQTAATTAAEKATQAVVAANSVTGDITKIWGRMREIYTPELTETHDYAVSALWFYNGLTVPTSDEFPTNTAGAYDSVFIPTGNGASEVKLHVKGLSYAEDAIFSVVVMCQKLTLYAENTELGYLTRDAGDKTFGWLCFSVRIVQGGIFAITEMANCTFTLTYAGTTYSVLVPPAIPSVDSALSGSSENPVQNKVVKAALDGKAERMYEVKGIGRTITDNNQVFYVSSDSAEATLSIDIPNIDLNNSLKCSILRYTSNRYPTLLKLKCSYDGLDSNEVSIAGMEQGTLYRLDILIMYASETTLVINVVVNPSAQ